MQGSVVEEFSNSGFIPHILLMTAVIASTATLFIEGLQQYLAPQ